MHADLTRLPSWNADPSKELKAKKKNLSLQNVRRQATTVESSVEVLCDFVPSEGI
jgi:hypothetical protein